MPSGFPTAEGLDGFRISLDDKQIQQQGLYHYR